MLFDGGGLFLYIPVARFDETGRPLQASKWWRFKYRFGGKGHLISFGTYPAVSLEQAREQRRSARLLLAQGINPSEDRRRPALPVAEMSLVTFASVAADWHAVASTDWAPGHARMIKSRMERYILPALGGMPIVEITTPIVMDVLRSIEEKGYIETTHRVRSIVSQVFVFAAVSGVPGVTGNPAHGIGRVLKRPATAHMSAILKADELGRLLRDIDSYPGSAVVASALRLAPMLFVRPGELRKAQWDHMDLDGGMWTIPAEEMKMRIPHVVPLSRQAVEVLRKLRPLTGREKYVFAGRSPSRPMSENTINVALRTMGWGPEKIVGHGFRATARTMLHERLGFTPDAIEAQLAHAVPDRLGGAYNRTQHIEERTRMMQAWADYLDELKGDAR